MRSSGSGKGTLVSWSVMAVLILVEDLLFCSRIEAAAAHLAVPVIAVGEPTKALRLGPETSWEMALVDLDAQPEAALHAIRHLRERSPKQPIVGFCSHVDVDLQQRGREAGCSLVLPRSAFAQSLPALLHQAAQEARG